MNDGGRGAAIVALAAGLAALWSMVATANADRAAATLGGRSAPVIHSGHDLPERKHLGARGVQHGPDGKAILSVAIAFKSA